MRAATLFTTLLLSVAAVNALPVPKQAGGLVSDDDSIKRGIVELESRRKHRASRSGEMTSPRITFYSGSQLDNPACGGPNPSPHSMIAAVQQGGAFSCGDRIHIQHEGKSVNVHVIDYCESCSPHSLDLSPGAFSQLASLDQGVIEGAKMWIV